MYVNINRVMTVAQRLCDAGHYAAPSIRLQANKLDKDWRTFAAALDDRSTVLHMSVIFHKKAHEVRNGYWKHFGYLHIRMRCDKAFIDLMHCNKRCITYLLLMV